MTKLVVLPTSRAIRQKIEEVKHENQLLPKYIAIGDFFQRVIVEKDHKYFIDKTLKILYLKEAIKDIDIQQLGFSKEFSIFFKQSEYIFKFFLELASEYIDIEKLLQYDTYELYADHIKILQLIYKNYTNLLDKYNYSDNILLPYNYKINTDYISQFDGITIYLEGYLSTFEFKILEDISKIKDTNIVFHLNEYNKKNLVLFQDIPYDYKLGYTYHIDLTNKSITKTIPYKINTQDITISPVKSKIEQIAFIKYHITQMCKTIEPQNIVVVVPDEQISFFLDIFDNEHYFNFAMGRTIKNHKLIKTLNLINKLIIDQEPTDSYKFEFLNIDENIFKNIFLRYWNNTLNKNIFDAIMEYIFSFDLEEDLQQQIEHIKISFEILFFTHKISYSILIKDFMKLLLQELATIKLDDTLGGKITVLGILETRAIEYDGVIVIDFNDNNIPKLSVKDKFISSNLKQQVGLPTIQDRENLQRYYYKQLFNRAKNIAISFVDDDTLVMSRFLVQLFPNYKTYLKKYNFSSILHQNQNLIHTNTDIVLNIDLSQQLWSASALKTYLQCKRKYYFQYIAKIKNHIVSLRPQTYEIGNIIHQCLDKAVKQDDLTIQFIDKYITTYQKQNPYLVIELELWKKRLHKFIEYENIRKQNNITILETEKDFSILYNNINLIGTIDRIDKYPDGCYEILDYKTSTSLKIDTPKTYEKSCDFQLEFYYLSQKDKMIKNIGYYTLHDTVIHPEVVLEQKLELLDLHLKALHTKTVNFKQTTDTTHCLYCQYKTVCNR